MHWYQPIEQRIIDWRKFRQSLTGDDIPSDLLAVQQFWYTSPWRKLSQLREDHNSWPTPWNLLESMSYCDLARALGMFYTIKLSPALGHLDANLVILDGVADRASIVEIDQGKYILNFNPDKLVNTSCISSEYCQRRVYTPNDFKTLGDQGK